MELQPNIDSIIEFLLNAETEKIINDLAQKIIEQGIPQTSTYQLMGIALLAVDDAKTQEHPSSANPIYKAVFDRAKKLTQQT